MACLLFTLKVMWGAGGENTNYADTIIHQNVE